MTTNIEILRPLRITFFYTDNCERQALEPIACEAKKRGLEVLFSTNSREPAQIGVYCEHACVPNADFSVILLHDLAQRHDIWPNFWHCEPWNKFDIGCLPGQSWVERWQNQADFPISRPRLGVFDVGWPKADLVFKDRDKFIEEAKKLRETLGLKYEKSILYAPSWENDGKQDDFVKAFKDLPVNVLLKQAPWSSSYPQVLENIRQMNELHRNCAENVHIIDVEVSIMYCLSLADVLVSDESSVLTEALLLDVPGVAVTDWLIPDANPPRPASVPYDYVEKTTLADMQKVVLSILSDPEAARAKIRQDRDCQFSHLGSSSVLIMDLIESGYLNFHYPNLTLSQKPLSANVDIDRIGYRQAEKHIENNRTTEGLDILFGLLKADTPCWEVYNNLGNLSFKYGDVEDAIFLLKKAISVAPQPIVSICSLVEIYCATDQTDKALLLLAQLSRQLPASQQKASSIRACMAALIATH